MINARIETVTEKPAYRRLIPRGARAARCSSPTATSSG